MASTTKKRVRKIVRVPKKRIKPFDTLPISTQTVMGYTNCTFNLDNMFKNLPVEEIDCTNIKKIKGEHGKIYQLKYAAGVRGIPTKSGNFRNQITAYLFVIDKLITMKIFPTGKFHMTGCKRKEHPEQAVIQLLLAMKKYSTPEAPMYTMDVPEQPITVTIEVVMINVDFHLGFEVDQQKLDDLLRQTNNDFYTIYDTPVNTSVNVKLDYPEPDAKNYPKIIIDGDPDKPDITYTTTDICPKATPKNTRTHTFLVFSSSKVIQSGRYYDTQMEIAYRKFHDFIIANRKKIELKLNNEKFDMSQLKGLGNGKLKLNLGKDDRIKLT